MAAINIRRDVEDQFYRYKMPRLTAKVEGKGNGIKTVVVNLTEIARALSRPPSYPTKYFGSELGAQVKCDDKNDRYIVNGAHTAERLQDILDGFISKFVLCYSCKNPETDYIIEKDTVYMDCKACGKRNMADMRHKLSTFIVKNPPDVASKKQRKQRKAATAQANDALDGAGNPDIQDEESNGHSADGEDDDIISRRIQKEAAGLSMQSQLADEDWSEDTSDAAVAERMKELTMKDSGETPEVDMLDQFGEWLADNKEASVNDIKKEVEKLGDHEQYKSHQVCQVLIQCIFDEDIVTQIPKRAKVLEEFVKTEKDQKATLGGIERLVGEEHKEHKDALLKKMPTILMKLYDVDVIEDDVFLKWGEKPSKRYVDKEVSKEVKKAAEPFLDWLKNASEEEDSEEE